MTVDQNMAPSSTDKKIQMHIDNPRDNNQHLQKARRLFQSTSIVYPILLTLLLIVGVALLAITISRRNICRQLQEERIETSLGLLPKDHAAKWTPCVKTSRSSVCACPASFIHSTVNPSHCIPSHSRCLHSCKTNPHCVCQHLNDAIQCREVTRNWIEKEFLIGHIQHIHDVNATNNLQYPSSDSANHQLEQSLVDTQDGERLFFSADRRTAVTIHEKDDDYLLNERWTKIETNTTQQHIVYTQLNPQTHTCRMSSVQNDGSITHGLVHKCPHSHIDAPYFVGVACRDVLILWHDAEQSTLQQDEGWIVSRHNFESVIPHLPVLLDPFHRYYSLYKDLMIEIKNLNGDVLAQVFTDIHRPTKFEFVDQYGTILIANKTHMQLLSSTNKEAWLDI